MPGHLENIADRVWVVQQCLAHTAEDYATQQGWLQYGLQVTAEHCHLTDLTACVEGELVSLEGPHHCSCLSVPVLWALAVSQSLSCLSTTFANRGNCGDWYMQH